MQSYTILCIDCKAASDNRWSTFTCTYSEYNYASTFIYLQLRNNYVNNILETFRTIKILFVNVA